MALILKLYFPVLRLFAKFKQFSRTGCETDFIFKVKTVVFLSWNVSKQHLYQFLTKSDKGLQLNHWRFVYFKDFKLHLWQQSFLCRQNNGTQKKMLWNKKKIIALTLNFGDVLPNYKAFTCLIFSQTCIFSMTITTEISQILFIV